MESPIEATWAFLEFNGISLVSREEMPKFTKDGSQVDLIWVGFVIKNLPSCMNGVGNNDDFGNVLFVACLVNAISNGEKFSFCTSDEGHVMNCLD